MHDFTDLIDRYIAIWNETDAEARHDLIARTWDEHASYRDPLMQGDGHAEIDAMIRYVQARFPAHRLQRSGAVDHIQDRVRFAWQLAAASGPVIAAGTDFGIVAADGRLQAITGFLDSVPA